MNVAELKCLYPNNVSTMYNVYMFKKLFALKHTS